MNIKDTYIHEGPGGTNAKALLKDFSITSTLIVLTRAKLTADGSADETDNPITIPTWNQSTTGNAATASALSVIKSTAATAHYLTFVDSNNDSAANENFYTTANISIVPSTGTLTLTNTSAPALVINNTHATTTHDCGILFLRSGVVKGWVGYRSDYGMYIYNKARAKYLNYKDDGSLLFEGNKVWHAGNDGTGSGLDADLLDGQHLSDLDARYVLISGDTMTGALTVPSLSVTGAATFSQAINGSILGNAATASRLQNARTISLTGSVTGSGTFDGSGDLSITTTTNHSHNYVNTIGKSGSTITWSIDGTAQTALDFSTTFAPYNADGYLPLSGGTMTGDITMTNGKSIILTNYTTASSFGSTDRAIPFSITDLPSKIAWTCTDSNLGLTFNPHTGALKSGSFVKRGGTSSQFLKADGSVDSNSYLISSTDVTTATWTAKIDDVNYPIAFSPNETPATSGNGYNTGFTFNPGIKTFNNNGCRLQYDSTNKVLKFIFD